MANIDLEELKRLVAAIDGKDGLDKTRAIANLSLGPVPVALACRVLELEEERAVATWQAYRDALSARNKALARVLELAAEVERLNRLQSLATTRLAEYNADLQAAEAKLREIAEIADRVKSYVTADYEAFASILKLARSS